MLFLLSLRFGQIPSGLLQVILPRPRTGMLSLVTVSPVITAFHSCCLSHIYNNIQKFGTDPILEDQIRIYETKKSILDRPSGPVAQRIEAVSLFGSRWALSEDSSFKSYPSRPEVYLVTKTWCDRQQLWKAVITGDTVTRLSIPIRGRGKSPEEGQSEFGRNVVKEETTQKTTKMRGKSPQ